MKYNPFENKSEIIIIKIFHNTPLVLLLLFLTTSPNKITFSSFFKDNDDNKQNNI